MATNEFIKFSEYTSSVLNDEATSAILAWIERSGMTSEDEIVNETGISKSDLSQILLRLYKNNFVSFGPNTVRVTSIGKTLLHTLGYDADIIESALDDFEFDLNTKRDLMLFLTYSRTEHYEEYLKTIFDLKVWKLITLEIGEKLKTNAELGYDQIGALSHMRHLCNRLSYITPFEIKLEFKPKNNFTKCLLISDVEKGKQHKISIPKEQNELDTILTWTNQIYQVPSNISKKEFESEFEYYFALYGTTKHNVDQNAWYLKWFDKDEKSKKKTDGVKRLNKYFHSHREFYKPTMFQSQTNFQHRSAELMSVVEVLNIFKNCSDHNELSQQLHISEHEAIGLITNFTTELNKLI